MAWDKSSRNDIGQLLATADLSGSQYLAVAFDSSGGVSLVAAAGGRVDGILQNAPTLGQAALVRPSGVSKMVAGGTIAAGALLKSDATGKAVTASAGVVDSTVSSATDPVIGSHILGRALSSAVSGDIFPVDVTPGGVVPTTAA